MISSKKLIFAIIINFFIIVIIIVALLLYYIACINGWGLFLSTCINEMTLEGQRVLAQFKSEEGSLVGTPFDLPVETTQESLLVLCNVLLENVSIIQYNSRQ